MAITRVQYRVSGNDESSSDPTFNAFTSNVTAGNLIVVVTRAINGSVTVSDTQGNSYTRHLQGETGSEPWMTLWSAVVGTTGANTVSFSNTGESDGRYQWLVAVEYSPGSDTWSSTAATRYDAGNVNVGTGNDPSSGALTTADAGLVVMAAGHADLLTYTVGSTFTLIDGGLGGAAIDYGGIQERFTSGALSSFTGSLTGTSTAAWRSVIAGFHVTAGGGGGSTPARLIIQPA